MGVGVVGLDFVDEVAAGAVGAVALGVEGAAELGLVFGVAVQVAEFAGAVRELTLVAVFAGGALLEGAAQLGLVALGGLHLLLLGLLLLLLGADGGG